MKWVNTGKLRFNSKGKPIRSSSYFKLEFALYGSTYSNFFRLISLIVMGEIRKEPATPSDPHKAAKAVAVVRSSDGNQLADNKGGAAWVTGPAKPFKN